MTFENVLDQAIAMLQGLHSGAVVVRGIDSSTLGHSSEALAVEWPEE